MSDFLGRLEQELVAAARREAAPVRARRLRLRPAGVLVGAACAIALALVLAAGPRGPAPDRPAPVGAAGALTGTWTAGAGATLSFTADGWRVEAPGAVLYGGLTVRDGRVLLRPAFDAAGQRLPGGGGERARRLCATSSGTYAAALEGGRLELRAVADACAPRVDLVEGVAWRRAR